VLSSLKTAFAGLASSASSFATLCILKHPLTHVLSYIFAVTIWNLHLRSDRESKNELNL